MTKTFRVFAKRTTYYENTIEAETIQEATAVANECLIEDFAEYNELSSNEPEIYDTVEAE